MDEEKLIILVQERECLYNLDQGDYDNYLINDNCWKKIAGEVRAKLRNKPHNILFTIQKLTDVMRL